MAFFLKRDTLLFLVLAIIVSLVFLTKQGVFIIRKTEAASESFESPQCLGLSSYPSRGGAVLTATFTGAGVAYGGKITAFEFDFGDGQKEVVEKEVGEAGTHSLTHSYLQPGVFWVSLRVKGDNGQWSEIEDACRVEIKIEGEILGGISTQPRAGIDTFLILGLVFSNLTGITIKRFLS